MKAADIVAAMEKALAEFPLPRPDPFAFTYSLGIPARLCGLDVHEVAVRKVPCVELRDVKIGAPTSPDSLSCFYFEPFSIFSPEFRAETNRWLREKFGTRDETPIPRGTAYLFGGSHLLIRRDDVVKLTGIA